MQVKAVFLKGGTDWLCNYRCEPGNVPAVGDMVTLPASFGGGTFKVTSRHRIYDDLGGEEVRLAIAQA